MSESNSQPGVFSPGDFIGKYEVREVLGAGGQSVVYKCYDELLDRFVAIKQISANLTQDAKYLEMFRGNLRTIARIGAKNDAVVTVHEVIEDNHGLFYVMEFVSGHTLETLLRESDGPFETKAALLILFRLAAALNDVHAAGVVHRDLKPSNIIVGDGLRPKIIDFGVAAVAGADFSMPLATTKYLAPELYQGQQVDGRADIYSLGFIVYEMLLGREQFNQVFEDITRDKHSESLRWMKWHGNPSVSAPMLHEVNPAIPMPLSMIVAKMMDKTPENRFENTEELGRAVKAAFSPKARLRAAGAAAGMGQLNGDDLDLGGAPVRGPQVSPHASAMDDEDLPTAPMGKGPMSKAAKRNLLIAAGAMVFLVLAGLGFMMYQNHLKKEAFRKSAKGLYMAGADAFKTEDYQTAEEKFATVLNEYPNTPQAKKSEILRLMSQAHLAIENLKFPQAQKFITDAEEANADLQKATQDDRTYQWTQNRDGDLKNLGAKMESYERFNEGMTFARGDFKQIVRPEDCDILLKALDDRLSHSSVSITEKQKTQLTTFTRQVRERRFQLRIEEAEKKINAAVNDGDFAKANKELKDALALFEQPEAQFASRDWRENKKTELNQRIKKLVEDKARSRLFENYRNALTPGDKKKAIIALLGLDDLTPAQRQQFQKELAQLELQDARQQARELDKTGNAVGSLAAWQKVLEKDPTDKEAKERIARLKRSATREEYVAQGDQAFLKGDFKKALGLYYKAAPLGMSQTLREKINKTNFEIKLAAAKELGKAEKYDDAIKLLMECKRLDPSRGYEIDSLILGIQKRKQYQDFLNKGDAAFAKNEWSLAIKYYEQAQQTDPKATTPAERIKLVKYKKGLTEGDAARDRNDPKVALWHYKKAQEAMNTKEIQERIKSVSE